MSDASKTYLAEITFGVETDSYDLDGRVTRVKPTAGLSASDVERALTTLTGEIDQIPPMHSALKVGGRRLYELARAGQEIERAPRRVTINELRLVDWRSPVATVVVDSSKGTYVRSIARDVGEHVGTGAHLSNLVRLRTGPFTLEDAWTLTDIAETDIETEWPNIAIHPDDVMGDRPVLVLAIAAATSWMNGGSLEATGTGEGPVRVYDAEGNWLGVGRFDRDRGAWRPLKVIRTAA